MEARGAHEVWIGMQAQSIARLFRTGFLSGDRIGVRPPLHVMRPLDAESLEGRLDGHRRRLSNGEGLALSRKLKSSARSQRPQRTSRAPSERLKSLDEFDKRQRAMVKTHYFAHADGGGASLRAHASYIARDAAQAPTTAHESDRTDAEARTGFYDGASEGIDGHAKAALWASGDRRHFRIILSAENGSALGDLKSYTREVMRRTEAAVGSRLEWVAVDHWDTDNPHTHIIVRGVREDGRDLVIPRAFVQHGMRNAAREIATERLGERTRADDRAAFQREARAHRPTELDRLIALLLPQDREILIANLRVVGASPEKNDALKARARELARLGLAEEVTRNVLRFRADWQDELKAMELHLDKRKSIVRARAEQRTISRSPARPKTDRSDER